MGKWNKAVILTVDPRFRDNAFILNEMEGIWDSSGAWYSNDMYQGFYPGKYTYTWDADDQAYWPSVLGKPGEDMPDTCWECKSKVNYKLHGECPICGICFDCGEKPNACLCYVPTRRLDTATLPRDLGELRSMG
jgi:glutamine amidotransferase